MNRFTKIFLLGIVTAALFSAFIYFEYFGISNKLINTFFGLGAIALLLYIPKKAVLVAGFFIGLFWFYWIGYSFKYQGVGYMEPIITFSFGIIYLIFFAPLSFTDKPYIRAVLLFGLSFIEPLGWNWMKIELLFVNSYIGVYKYQLVAVLLALSLPALIKHKTYKFLPLLLLVFAFNYGYPKQYDAPLKIKLIQTNIPQEIKWTREALYPTIRMVYQEIQKAQNKGYDVVVFPESVFPLFMNKTPKLMQELKKASKKITIIAGALLSENNLNYNVTYMFYNGKYKVAKKLILVPFGEYIPLPKFAQKIINDTFFQGGSDFVTAKKPTDFEIKGIKFRNAICYEATCKELYTGDVKYMIAISNNAWFTPSIEPTLQKLLIEYYGRKNGVTIYHAANIRGTGIIK
ncbi:apolipoprotein N-acyltransferase [Sulfurimonas autotrophica]|uniref:Apolipoprotein N-acyltransferase n=1 Tax=Sulfurimonas autotrophica (strain ATCC BAA-671 / DSM 16294 / JCM 11897 / OK10) TaxID=563040 RepID=E0UPN9_SULAO|nr:apolipoprotein N-acyltransferase [Sulfurimonas autotrophica]ADN08631.1 apolipoprotein N-acyltransferase [Sulfurimonas autotrophica DSM 16294]